LNILNGNKEIRSMKAASIHELKQELTTRSPKELVDLCLRLARFKKENKELLTYLLYEAHDEAAYISSVKHEIDEQFATINVAHLYFVKKTLRKILRVISKHTRYTGSRQAEAEWLIYFCGRLSQSGIPFEKSPVLFKLYQNQVKKIQVAIDAMHEDLQFDYRKELAKLDRDG
jgi:hypothetical protein